MSNSEIRRRAGEILNANLIRMLAVSATLTALGLLNDKTENTLVSFIISVAGSFLNAGYIYFILHSWIDGISQPANILVPFTQAVYRNKIIPVILTETLLVLASALPVGIIFLMNMKDPFMLMMNWAVLLLALIPILIMGMAITLVWYIYVLKPETNVWDMFKLSASYMKKHWGGYFVFGFTLMIIPVLISTFLESIVGKTTLTILLIPIEAYIALARAGYVYETILNPASQADLRAIPMPEADIIVLPHSEETAEKAEESDEESHNDDNDTDEIKDI